MCNCFLHINYLILIFLLHLLLLFYFLHLIHLLLLLLFCMLLLVLNFFYLLGIFVFLVYIFLLFLFLFCLVLFVFYIFLQVYLMQSILHDDCMLFCYKLVHLVFLQYSKMYIRLLLVFLHFESLLNMFLHCPNFLFDLLFSNCFLLCLYLYLDFRCLNNKLLFYLLIHLVLLFPHLSFLL